MIERFIDKAAHDVIEERERQQCEEGWTAQHDDGHSKGEMAKAAACYAIAASYSNFFRDARRPNEKLKNEWEGGRHTALRSLWPWHWKWWKPTDRRRDLVKAGALILAEIERLDRAGADANQQSKTGGTQASDSLARISSSHPEDGGIRGALEHAIRRLEGAAKCFRANDLKGLADNVDLDIRDIREMSDAALNPAPLPIGEEREKN